VYAILFAPLTCHFSRSSHSLGHVINIGGVSTDHEAPPYVVFSTALLPRPAYGTLFSNTVNLYSSFSVSDQVPHPYRETDISDEALFVAAGNCWGFNVFCCCLLVVR
jgi:hypothetical protein